MLVIIILYILAYNSHYTVETENIMFVKYKSKCVGTLEKCELFFKTIFKNSTRRHCNDSTSCIIFKCNIRPKNIIQNY